MGSNIASIQQINSFLMKIKHIAERNSSSFIVASQREENLRTMLELGFKDSHIIEEILGLTYRHYSVGPTINTSKDGFRKGDVWIFGKDINGVEIYIKIMIIETKRRLECICISFHKTDSPMLYPYRS